MVGAVLLLELVPEVPEVPEDTVADPAVDPKTDCLTLDPAGGANATGTLPAELFCTDPPIGALPPCVIAVPPGVSEVEPPVVPDAVGTRGVTPETFELGGGIGVGAVEVGPELEVINLDEFGGGGARIPGAPGVLVGN